ncbi:MAG: hypothetical protein AAF202_13900, partial [Pseudomonadota bacterium]
MMQMHLSALIIFIAGVIVSPASYAAKLCKPVAKMDQADVARKYGRDPASVVKKATDVLHNQFRAHSKNQPNQIFKDSSDLRIQMSIMINYFALNQWVEKLYSLTQNQSLDPLRRTEWDYVFTHWMRVRYLSSVQELVRGREVLNAFREPAFARVKNQVVESPAQLVVTDYKPFVCESKSDFETYDCSKNYIMVNTQLSPNVMCSNPEWAKQANF